MIVVHQCKLPCGVDIHTKEGASLLEGKLRKVLRIRGEEPLSWKIVRHSVDARKKPDLFDIYSCAVSFGKDRVREQNLVKKLRDRNVLYEEPAEYHFPVELHATDAATKQCPVIVGFGPAGIFAGLLLARAGLRPIILERGKAMAERVADVERLWQEGILDPSSNCQFGEGGAGTFSDGKLNTNVKDRQGRTDFVLRTFIEAGATEDIAYEFHPHIGTDVLRNVVVNLRNEIISLGGEVRFQSEMTDLHIEGGRVAGVTVRQGTTCYDIPTDTVILAPGHSARNTIRRLYEQKIPMEQKAFAVGLRVSHPQSLINHQQYGISDERELARLHLPAVSYKLTAHAKDGRGVYSFCMCPGGYIVNASSEPGRLAVNGMSDYLRDSRRANSAVVVTVDSDVFQSEEVLAGMEFQEQIEEKAFRLADGRVPVERYRDFEQGFAEGAGVYEATPDGNDLSDAERLCIKGQCHAAPVHTLMPEELTQDFIEGMQAFEHRIPGYTGDGAYVCGIESRTSSPVRILRGEDFQSEIEGLYPCGEGAGYAGGITSAAIDGMKVAEAAAAHIAAKLGTD